VVEANPINSMDYANLEADLQLTRENLVKFHVMRLPGPASKYEDIETDTYKKLGFSTNLN
jgi:hypothetical protein